MCNNHKERVVEVTWNGVDYEVEILDEDKWLLVNIATGKEQVCAKTDFHAHFQNMVLEKLGSACNCKTNNAVIKNNDGRDTCFSCGELTRPCGGFYFGIDYRICTKCGK